LGYGKDFQGVYRKIMSLTSYQTAPPRDTVVASNISY